jgi:hypothetical protein
MNINSTDICVSQRIEHLGGGMYQIVASNIDYKIFVGP